MRSSVILQRMEELSTSGAQSVRPSPALSLDQLHGIMATPRRASLVHFFVETGRRRTSLEECADYVRDRLETHYDIERDPKAVLVGLYHVDVPSLEDMGVLSTAGDDLVYYGDDTLERWFDQPG